MCDEFFVTDVRNLIFQAKLQNSLCSCTSWGYMCNTNDICDTYPESSRYKLLKNARKSWNNQKSFWTILELLDKNTQKRILCAEPIFSIIEKVASIKNTFYFPLNRNKSIFGA